MVGPWSPPLSAYRIRRPSTVRWCGRTEFVVVVMADSCSSRGLRCGRFAPTHRSRAKGGAGQRGHLAWADHVREGSEPRGSTVLRLHDRSPWSSCRLELVQGRADPRSSRPGNSLVGTLAGSARVRTAAPGPHRASGTWGHPGVSLV